MNKNFLKPLVLITQLGLRLITPIVICLLGGIYLDEKLGTGYTLTLILLVLGGASSIYELYRMSQSYKDL